MSRRAAALAAVLLMTGTAALVPSSVSAEDQCRSAPSETPPVSVVLVAAPGVELAAVDRALDRVEAIDVVGRLTTDDDPASGRGDEWDAVDSDELEATLRSLAPDRGADATVVVPLGAALPLDPNALPEGLAVAQTQVTPTEDAVTSSALGAYVTTLPAGARPEVVVTVTDSSIEVDVTGSGASVDALLEGLTVTAGDGGTGSGGNGGSIGGSVTSSTSTPGRAPGETTTTDAPAPTGFTVACTGQVLAPVRFERPEGWEPSDLSVSGTVWWQVGAEPDQIRQGPVALGPVTVAEADLRTEASSTGTASENDDDESGSGKVVAAGDPGGSPVSRLWPWAVLAVVLAAIGAAVLRRQQPGGGAPAVASTGAGPAAGSFGAAPAQAPVSTMGAAAGSYSPPPEAHLGASWRWISAVSGGAPGSSDPATTGAGSSWGLEVPGAFGAAGVHEKIDGHGEDAPPLLALHQPGGAVAAVFDGLGGAGAALVAGPDGSVGTEARAAALLARRIVERWGVDGLETARPDADALHAALASGFADAASSTASGGAMKGTLHRRLPTTMAAVVLDAPAPRRPRSAQVLWAGDSRAFLLTPTAGLQVLSLDDTRETDALALIRNDEPLANMICGDRGFSVNRAQVAITEPAMLLVATDGCFGYVRTPAHFEFLLVDALLATDSPAAWAQRVLRTVSGFTADDASFAALGVGLPPWPDLVAAFTRRHRYLDEQHWAPFRGDDGSDAPADDDRRDRSWAEYRGLYEARQPARPTEGIG